MPARKDPDAVESTIRFSDGLETGHAGVRFHAATSKKQSFQGAVRIVVGSSEFSL
jgi:hypothetical protein